MTVSYPFFDISLVVEAESIDFAEDAALDLLADYFGDKVFENDGTIAEPVDGTQGETRTM